MNFKIYIFIYNHYYNKFNNKYKLTASTKTQSLVFVSAIIYNKFCIS